ncbi:MAG: hypothetical protein SNF68_03290 [Rikenellaceae bacterium]
MKYMRIKTLLLLFFTAITLTSFAQRGGVRARVISCIDRTPIGGAQVRILGTDRVTTTNDMGEFMIDKVDSMSCTVLVSAAEYEDYKVETVVSNMVRNLYTIVMVPFVEESAVTVGKELFDQYKMDWAMDGLSSPVTFSADDVFSDAASYQFSEMRFNPRGYDSKYSSVYLNGVLMNDANTGYGAWSLWSGLNEATRSKESTWGLESGESGVGSLYSSTNILARASSIRKGFNVGLVNTNGSYRARVMATYATGVMDNGWAFAVSGSTRQGDNSYVEGAYYNSFAYFGSAEKHFASGSKLALTILGSPSERGMQSATTDEVYELTGDNYYNPNVGYQNGKLRNARVRDAHEPVAIANYEFQIGETVRVETAASFRFGKNGYSALTWYAGSDPRPDYYHYLPSYYNAANPALTADQWIYNTDNIRYIDWDNMYEINSRGDSSSIYGDGVRATYMVEERHADQLDGNFSFKLTKDLRNNSTLRIGATLRRNRTENYSMVKDLLGADYWVDIDKFAQRDFASDEVSYQNNLDYYYANGHAEAVKVGDKYSYNYFSHTFDAKVWGAYDFAFANLPRASFVVSGEVGYSSLWREGLWRKGLFVDDSKGDSEMLEYITYKAKANFGYRFDAHNTIAVNAFVMDDAPEFQSSFISPRTRNSITPNLDSEKVYAVDAQYKYVSSLFTLNLSGYYTQMRDQNRVISFYNDLQNSYDNFAMSGIDKRYYGVEFGVEIPLTYNFSIHTAGSFGDYSYTSNPYYIEMADNSADALSEGVVMWEGFKVEGTPQTAVNAGISYRSDDYLFISLDYNLYNNNFISMNPLLRTDEVLSGLTTEEMVALRSEENLGYQGLLNLSIGKSWSFNRKSYLNVNLSVNNLLNKQDFKTGGFEQMRLNDIEAEDGTVTYEPFDSKYYYALGTTYYLNVSYRF